MNYIVINCHFNGHFYKNYLEDLGSFHFGILECSLFLWTTRIMTLTYSSYVKDIGFHTDPCLPEGEYSFTIIDADGICCSYGQGNYNITTPNGGVLAEGGDGEFTCRRVQCLFFHSIKHIASQHKMLCLYHTKSTFLNSFTTCMFPL